MGSGVSERLSGKKHGQTCLAFFGEAILVMAVVVVLSPLEGMISLCPMRGALAWRRGKEVVLWKDTKIRREDEKIRK